MQTFQMLTRVRRFLFVFKNRYCVPYSDILKFLRSVNEILNGHDCDVYRKIHIREKCLFRELAGNENGRRPKEKKERSKSETLKRKGAQCVSGQKYAGIASRKSSAGLEPTGIRQSTGCFACRPFARRQAIRRPQAVSERCLDRGLRYSVARFASRVCFLRHSVLVSIWSFSLFIFAAILLARERKREGMSERGFQCTQELEERPAWTRARAIKIETSRKKN